MEDVRGRVCLYAALSTLKYLAMSGRVGGLAAGMANLLNIKPILFIEDGDIIPLEKVRTTEKAIEKLFEFVAEFDNLEQTAIIQRGKTPSKEAKILRDRLARWRQVENGGP